MTYQQEFRAALAELERVDWDVGRVVLRELRPELDDFVAGMRAKVE